MTSRLSALIRRWLTLPRVAQPFFTATTIPKPRLAHIKRRMSARGVSAQTLGQTAEDGKGVLLKLVIFSLSLGIVPIASYFASEKYIWNGNSTFAAITAVVCANVVLVAYIITSLREDQAEQETRKLSESRKDR